MDASSRRRPVALLVFAVVLAGACGRDGSSSADAGGPGSTASTAFTSSTSASTAIAATTATSTTSPTPATLPTPATAGATTTTVADGSTAASGVRGLVLFSPVCPVERFPPDPQCAPRPGPADIRLLRADGTLAAVGRSGADGTFEVRAPAGRYRVEASAVTVGPGRGCEAVPEQVTVEVGSFTPLEVSCDTGIR